MHVINKNSCYHTTFDGEMNFAVLPFQLRYCNPRPRSWLWFVPVRGCCPYKGPSLIKWMLWRNVLNSGITTETIDWRSQNLHHLYSGMGLKLGVFGFSRDQNNCESSGAYVLEGALTVFLIPRVLVLLCVVHLKEKKYDF